VEKEENTTVEAQEKNKRLARLSLEAPPYGCVLAQIMIFNLLQRHPECQVLIHRIIPNAVSTKQVLLIGYKPEETQPGSFQSSPVSLETSNSFDPFRNEETDPAAANALQSSLWELKTLSEHYCPVVSLLTKLFQGDLSRTLYPLDDYLSESYQSLFDSALRKTSKATEPALAFTSKPLIGTENGTYDDDNDDFFLWDFR